MSSKLFYNVCSKSRYDKALPSVEARWNKRPTNQQKNICTPAEALSNPDLQKHFLRQRAQINSYYQQAKKESRKKYGDVSRDVKSLLTPYLFAMTDAKPEGDFKAFSKKFSSANLYLLNNIIAGFNPSLKPSKRRNRIIPFNNQLHSWWMKNKNTLLSTWMNAILRNPKNTYAAATEYQGKSRLTEKRDHFKNQLKAIRQSQKGQEGVKEETEEDEDEWGLDDIEGGNTSINNNNNTTSSSSSSNTNL